MPERPRAELERLTQEIDREHPDWNAREIERELELRSPVVYGHWKDGTPILEARLRQVQRWRKGVRYPARTRTSLPFRYAWPVGEKQRRALDPTYGAGHPVHRATHRVFLYNCSEETLRELRMLLGGREVGYEPALPPGHFAEVVWTRNPAIRSAALGSAARARIAFPFRAEFAIVRGTRSAGLAGQLLLDTEDGWISFSSSDGQSKELE